MGLVRLFILPNLETIARAIILIFYPLYRTVKAIESPSVVDDQQWLTYWIINYCLIFIELSCPRVFSWLFFWPVLKLIITTWLVLPQYNGAAYIYEYLVRQRILKVGGEGEERQAIIGERKLDERGDKGQKACIEESKLEKKGGGIVQKAYIGERKLDERGERGQEAYIGEKIFNEKGEGQKAYTGEIKSDEKGEGQKAYIGERKSDEKGEGQKAYIGERKLDEKEEEGQKPHIGESKLDEKEGQKEASICDGKIETRDASKALDASENQTAYKDAVTVEPDTKLPLVVPKESTLPETRQPSSPIKQQSETTKIVKKQSTRRWFTKDRAEKPNP